MLNLRLTWVVVQNSTNTAILAVNVLGASVIDHSVFQSSHGSGIPSNYHMNEYTSIDDRIENEYNRIENEHDSIEYIRLSYHLYIGYENCNHKFRKCHNETESLSSHELQIHNSVLRNGRDGSMLDLMNITALNGGGSYDIPINIGSEANYLLTLRDSNISCSGGAALSVLLLPPITYVSQLIHIINSVIHKGVAGVDIHSAYYLPHNTVKKIPQIIVENCTIMDTSRWGLKVARASSNEHPQFSVVLKNVSFENNKLLQEGGLSLKFVKEIMLIDCKFVGNQGTPMFLLESTSKVSGTLSFLNNAAFQGGAIAFYRKSFLSVSLDRKILFKNNYAEHVGGAVFAKETEVDSCFLQLATHDSECSDLRNNHHLSLVFKNNTAKNGGDAIYGGFLQQCIVGHCENEARMKTPIVGAYIFIINYWNLVHYDAGHHSNLSLISSTPSRVCLCDDGEPDCLTTFVNDDHYPGETFSIPAIVVGQGCGTADGAVYAQFSNKDTARLEELQQSQHVNHSSCAKLKYTVFSAREKELMALSTRTMFSEYNPTNVHFLIDNYDLIEQTPDDVYNVYFSRHFIEDLLKLEVFININ